MLQMYCLWRCFFFGCREENGRRSLVIHIWKFSYKILLSTVCHLSQTSCLHRLRKLSAALGSAATLFLFPSVKCCYFIPLFCKETFRTRSTKEGILRGPLQRSYTELHFTVNKCNVQYFNGRLTTNLAGNFVRG